MAFPYWAAIGAGIKVLGSLGGLFGKSSGPDYDELLSMQKSLFDYQWSKQLEAMNTAHQRGVADLRQAGLNPILSGTGGSGLSSPTSSMPDVSSVNSAVVAAKQAKQQMIVNAMVALGDLAVRNEANNINNKSATANLMNANTNAVNTASQVQQRLVQNSNLSAQTKKTLEELNLIKSQESLNSAYASQALTNAWYQRQILPWDAYAKGTSGSVAGTMSYPIKKATEWLTDWMNKNHSTAAQKNKEWLKNHGSGFGFLGR